MRNSFDRWLTPARRVHVPSPPFRLNFSLLLSAVNRKAKKRRRKTNFYHGDISCSKKKLQAKSRVKLCTEKSYRAFFVAARLYQLIKHLRTFCPIYLPLQSSKPRCKIVIRCTKSPSHQSRCSQNSMSSVSCLMGQGCSAHKINFQDKNTKTYCFGSR